MESKTGFKVKLRTFTEIDLEKIRDWNEIDELSPLLGLKLPGQSVDYYKRCKEMLKKRNSRLYAIETEAGKFIGKVELNQISWRRKEAELHICIGDQNFWDKGYGTEAVQVLLKLAFDNLGLSCVYLRVYRHNKRAIRCYEKCGFKKEAILKNRSWNELGRGYDIILMKVVTGGSVPGTAVL